MSQKNNHFFEENHSVRNYPSVYCITSAVFASKLNMWFLVVISLGFVRRGAISMIGKTSGQLSLGAGTGENASGKAKGPS